PPLIARQDVLLTEAERGIAQRNGTFAFELLRNVCRNEKPQANVFISPLSASLALSMLDNGADGDTHREIQAGLGFEGFTREEQNGYAQKMVKAMQELDPRGAFGSANSIWIKREFEALESFREVNRRYFESEVRNEDFSAPATLALINGWISEKTYGRIADMLTEIPSGSVMYLINALYFKGMWAFPFDEALTSGETFRSQDGSASRLPTMKLTDSHLRHAAGEQFALLELPFGNGAFSMTVLLPDEGVSLASVVERMNGELWEQCLAGLERDGSVVHVRLPKFTIEYERTLDDDLKAMGMTSMFDPVAANLSLIHPTALLAVSTVKQKTFAEVNEKGMEAAAATVVEIMDMANLDQPAPPRVDFYVDRPFLFFVSERSTGSIFFAGAIRNLE
ncbi:MAG: serpin family protein, partial [Tannerella sp.]|nr:serpin family protein [Tannerella sp.]